MTAKQAPRLDRDNVLLEGGITPGEFKSTGLSWPLIEEICAHHEKSVPALRSAGTFISERLQHIAAVHSLKIRTKNPEHLAAKIIRKKLERPEMKFDIESYSKQITDLVGLRALHLFKDEWRPIHDFVKEAWELDETPIAYVREGDQSSIISEFEAAECEVRKHPFGYRSIHYLIKFPQDKKTTCIVELQVRTIFEEGWSEIDHRFRYPRRSHDVYLAECLGILNRLCGNADEMGTFIVGLRAFGLDQEKRLKAAEAQIAKQEAELKRAVSALKISKAAKENLEEQIEALRRSSQPASGRTVGGTPNVMYSMSSLLGSNLGAAVPSVASIVGLNSSFLGPLEQTCTSCGKKYPNSPFTAAISNLCADCSAKFLRGY